MEFHGPLRCRREASGPGGGPNVLLLALGELVRRDELDAVLVLRVGDEAEDVVRAFAIEERREHRALHRRFAPGGHAVDADAQDAGRAVGEGDVHDVRAVERTNETPGLPDRTRHLDDRLPAHGAHLLVPRARVDVALLIPFDAEGVDGLGARIDAEGQVALEIEPLPGRGAILDDGRLRLPEHDERVDRLPGLRVLHALEGLGELIERVLVVQEVGDLPRSGEDLHAPEREVAAQLDRALLNVDLALGDLLHLEVGRGVDLRLVAALLRIDRHGDDLRGVLPLQKRGEVREGALLGLELEDMVVHVVTPVFRSPVRLRYAPVLINVRRIKLPFACEARYYAL